MKDKIVINEIFISFEGEGPFVGMKTLFVRLAGCPLRCYWCDTEYALEMIGTTHNIDELANKILDLAHKNNVDKMNLTGGDPLMQLNEVRLLCEKLKGNSRNNDEYIPLYLESSCYSSYAMSVLLPFIDYMKVEFKLPSSKAMKNMDALINEEIKSLQLVYTSHNIINYYIKIIVSEKEDYDDINMIFKRMNSLSKDVNNDKRFLGVYIQPEYRSLKKFTMQDYNRFYDTAKQYFDVVRILPQVHKMLLLE